MFKHLFIQWTLLRQNIRLFQKIRFTQEKLVLSKNYNEYRRSYMKIQSLAAQVGGFLNVLIISCGFFNKYLNSFLRNRVLMNELFIFKYPDKSIITNHDFEEVQNKINNFIQKSIPERNDISINKFKRNSNEIELFKKSYYKWSKDKNINTSIPVFSHFFSQIFPKIKEFYSSSTLRTLNAYLIGEEFLKRKLDIISYLKLHDIVYKLKSLLLNSHQSLALDFINKNNLLNQGHLNFIEKTIKDNYDSNLDIVFEYFSDKIMNNSLDSLDKRIFDQFDEHFQKYLNKTF